MSTRSRFLSRKLLYYVLALECVSYLWLSEASRASLAEHQLKVKTQQLRALASTSSGGSTSKTHRIEVVGQSGQVTVKVDGTVITSKELEARIKSFPKASTAVLDVRGPEDMTAMVLTRIFGYLDAQKVIPVMVIHPAG